MTADEHTDEVLAALDALVHVISDVEARDRMTQRARTIRERRSRGERYGDIVQSGAQPLIVEVLSQHIDELIRASARFRRAEAAALHLEGLTMEQIADLFGVTRQRVSALLREARDNGTVDALRGSLNAPG